MTAGVVEAVAAVLKAHSPGIRGFDGSNGCCGCKWRNGGMSFEEHQAAAVQAALGLREEWTWSWPNGSAPGAPGFGFSVDTREEAELEGSNIVCRVVSPWVSVVRGTTQ